MQTTMVITTDGIIIMETTIGRMVGILEVVQLDQEDVIMAMMKRNEMMISLRII